MHDVTFLLGPSGAGKSSTVVREISEMTLDKPIGAPIFWVVPDDVAFAAEQLLMEKIPSALRPEVITLSRLAERIRQAAPDSSLQTINDTGKRLLFTSVYQEIRDQLGPLKRARANAGFYSMVLDAFDEMSRYQVNLATLQGALESAAASLSRENPQGARASAGRSLIGKLRDLCLLYMRYREVLEERGFFDPAFHLNAAARSIPDVTWVQEAVFYVDGFTKMDPQQIEFCTALAEHGTKTTFIFSLPENLPDEIVKQTVSYSSWPLQNPLSALIPLLAGTNHSHLPEAVYSAVQIAGLLRTRDISCRTRLLDETRRFTPGNLRRVEESLRKGEITSKSSTEAEDESVQFWLAPDEAAEMMHIAQSIVQAVEQKRVRYRDIAVLVPSIQEYGPRVAEAFERLGIPHVTNTFPPLSAHPLGRFCLAAIGLVEENMSVDAVARFLRTDFTGLRETDADWLDIYMRTHDITGQLSWFSEEPWNFARQQVDSSRLERALLEDERANRLRLQIKEMTEHFVQSLEGAVITPLQMATALWELFVTVHAKDKIARKVVSEDETVSPLQASQHEQAWQQVVALLNDLASVSEQTPFLREELFDLVREAFVSLRQSTIPSGVDEVFIASYAHAHFWEREIVYVAGLDERHLPERVHQQGLLQDEEREMFHRLFGMPLGRTTEELMASNRQLAYTLFSRAKTSMVMSYPATRGGAEVQPSPYYTTLQQVCGQPLRQLSEQVDVDDTQHAIVMSVTAALDWLVHRLSAAKTDGQLPAALMGADVLAVARGLLETEDRTMRMETALRGLWHDLPQGRVSPDLAHALFGQPIATSVHRLETYAACGYRHFLQYGLGIQPLKFATVEAAHVGNLLHDTVFELIELQRSHAVDIQNMSLEQMLSLAEETFSRQLQSPKHSVFTARKIRHVRASDLKQQLHAVAEMLWLHATQSAFTPTHLEWSFGLSQDDEEAFRLTTKDGYDVAVRGRIDRVDVVQDETSWFRIFDYKTRANHEVDLTKMYYGLQLQLMVYVVVVRELLKKQGLDAQPAGAFFIPLLALPQITDTPQDDESAAAAMRKVLRANGYMGTDASVIEAMDKDLPKGKSSLFSEVYKRDGTFRSAAKVWTPEEWEAVLQWTVSEIERLSSQMMSGDIRVEPYFYQHHDRGCTFCPFQAVCHFEQADHRQHYRVIRKKALTDMMTAQNARDGGGIE